MSEGLRTWRDSSGKYEVRATLVRVEESTVYLRNVEGGEIVVPLDRLSAADRDYLARPSAGNPFTPSPACEGISNPLVVVSIKAGAQETLLSALVYRAENGKAYLVLDGPGRQPGQTISTPDPAAQGEFTAIWDAHGKRQQVKLNS